jgi:hypothetical protein
MTENTITLDAIAAAETLMGVRYTVAERQLMLDNLEGQITAAIRCRAVPMTNDVPMALRFDPRLPGFEMPHRADRLRLTAVAAGVPRDDADIAFAPVTHLAVWIKSGALTSRRRSIWPGSRRSGQGWNALRQ